MAPVRPNNAQPLGDPLTEAQVYAAIADVLDPELDEPLVKLGFIDSVQINGQQVTVVFKLPTYWCAPNFAYLMASDLQAGVRALPGVQEARVVLLDHFAEGEITSGVNQGHPFPEAFPGETDSDLEDLRRTFARKGFLMRQEVLLRRLLKAGLEEEAIRMLRVADLEIDDAADIATITTNGKPLHLAGAGHSASLYLRKGRMLGLLQALDDPLFVDTEGQPILPGNLQAFLRRSRSIRISIAFNTALCTSLFRTRYGQVEGGAEGKEGELYEGSAAC